METKGSFVDSFMSSHIVKAALATAPEGDVVNTEKMLSQTATTIADIIIPLADMIRNDPKVAEELRQKLRELR